MFYPVCKRIVVNKPTRARLIKGYRGPLPLWLLWHRNGIFGPGTGNPGRGRKPFAIPIGIQLTPAFYALCPNP
jgi:hypothetical protein